MMFVCQECGEPLGESDDVCPKHPEAGVESATPTVECPAYPDTCLCQGTLHKPVDAA